jgi:hypothetical protein
VAIDVNMLWQDTKKQKRLEQQTAGTCTCMKNNMAAKANVLLCMINHFALKHREMEI